VVALTQKNNQTNTKKAINDFEAILLKALEVEAEWMRSGKSRFDA
jgi:hypothetical protein